MAKELVSTHAQNHTPEPLLNRKKIVVPTGISTVCPFSSRVNCVMRFPFRSSTRGNFCCIATGNDMHSESRDDIGFLSGGDAEKEKAREEHEKKKKCTTDVLHL